MMQDVHVKLPRLPSTAMATAPFNKKTLFTSKLDLNLRKKLLKCYIQSTALCYGAGEEYRSLLD
jgi:hypothetical protein